MGFDTSNVESAAEREIKDHMDTQPYAIRCMECGKSLDYEQTVDSDYDLSIEVVPCDRCLKEAKDG